MRSRLRWIAAVTLASATAAAGAEAPRPKAISYAMDEARQTTRPAVRALDPVNAVRAVIGKRRQAANVDENDQVRLPSTWWTPRVGFRVVTPEDMIAATGGDDAPAPGKWTIVKTKDEGVTPGFQITDVKGVKWAVKLDPPAEPELASAADVIGSKLMWAAGYNVPTNVAVTFGRQDLEIKKGLTYRDRIGATRPFDEVRLDSLLARGARLPDGRWRALASRFLDGKPIGEFLFDGRRRDDAEDLIPHDLRRELRGLWVVAAWINHDDCSARNTLDMWVTAATTSSTSAEPWARPRSRDNPIGPGTSTSSISGRSDAAWSRSCCSAPHGSTRWTRRSTASGSSMPPRSIRKGGARCCRTRPSTPAPTATCAGGRGSWRASTRR